MTMQAFEDIQVTLEGKSYTVEKSGNSPVLTKLLSGTIPAGEDFQVVIPLKLAEKMGFTPETALGKTVDFSASVFQWQGNTPIPKPVKLTATICGVADNTVVYDYEGQHSSFTVDDSFFFNRSAMEEIRSQAGISDKSANFTMRAKTPEDLISLKDELNKMGIVPLGRFELVEDIVRLNQQTARQSGSAGTIIALLSVLLAVLIFAMTALLRMREYAIYKVTGYAASHLAIITLGETLFSAIGAAVLFLALSPLLNLATKTLFAASILSGGKLLVGALLILAVSLAAWAAQFSRDIQSLLGKTLRLSWKGQAYQLTVSGIFNASYDDFFLSDDLEQSLYAGMSGKAYSLSYDVREFGDIVKVSTWLEEQGISSQNAARQVAAFQTTFRNLNRLFFTISLLILGIGLFISSILLIKQQNTRYHEVGLMAALGYGRGQISAMIVLENLLLSAIAAAATLVLTGVSALVGKALGFDLVLTLWQALGAVGLSCLAILVIGFLASHRLVHTQPADALRK